MSIIWIRQYKGMAHTNMLAFFGLLAAFSLCLHCEGGAICYECDSKANQCSPGSLTGAIEGACSRNNDYCAIYKKEPPGNTSYHQFTRYCASECEEADTITSYTTGGPYQRTKNCVVCCKGDFCNNYLYDPCNPPSTALDMKCGMFPIAILSVIAVIM